VQELLAAGKGIKPIMRELGLAKETVRRFARAASVEDLLAKARDGRPSVLDEFKPYLHERWNAGCTTVWTLFQEIRGRGYTGSYGTVRGDLQPFRATGAAPPAVPAPPKVCDVASVAATSERTAGRISPAAVGNDAREPQAGAGHTSGDGGGRVDRRHPRLRMRSCLRC
jgi:transposase